MGLAVGFLLGVGPVPVVPAVALAAVGVAGAYRRSDAVVLSVSHAEPADAAAYPRLHNVVEGLCTAAGLPKPRLHVVEDAAPNAFATGRDPSHASVVVTTGLLERLDRIELEGVLAHELSHVKSHDILVSTLAVTLIGGITLAADVALRIRRWGGSRHCDERTGGGGGPMSAVLGAAGSVLLLFAPLVAAVMLVPLGRQREARADVAAVNLTRYPPGLASALEKLRSDDTVVHSAVRATAHLWIAPPLPEDEPARTDSARTESAGRRVRSDRFSGTHRPLGERVDALREL